MKNGRKKRGSIAIAAILVVLISVGIMAIPIVLANTDTTYYVNDAIGDDTRTNAETQNPATPWKTIQHAVDNATAGDTIKVAAGTYNEDVDIPAGLDGLKLLGHSKADTVIGATTIGIETRSSVRIQGFHITTTAFTNGIKIRASGTEANPGVIQDNKIEGFDPQYGVGFVSGNQYWEIKDNEITNCRSGIYFEDVSHVTVSGNTFSECKAACGGILGDDVQIIWNTFAGSTKDDSEAIGFCSDGPTNLIITHNTITGYDYGIRVYCCGEFGEVDPSVQVHCNNIAGNSEYGILNPTCTNCVVGNSEYGTPNENDEADLDATNNWWGDASGPSHSPGTGDKVSDTVKYDPWLPTPFQQCPGCVPQVPAFSAIGLLALIGMLSVVLAVAIVRKR